MRIYLAGAISGCSYEEASGWRKAVTVELNLMGHQGLNPMGNKDELSKEQSIRVTPYDGLLLSDKAIVSRDRFSLLSSKIVLANLSYGENPLIGTSVEIGWADSAGIPIIAVCPKGSRFDHPFVRELCYCVDSLKDALKVILTYK